MVTKFQIRAKREYVKGESHNDDRILVFYCKYVTFNAEFKNRLNHCYKILTNCVHSMGFS